MNIKQTRDLIDKKLIEYRDLYDDTFSVEDVLLRLNAEKKSDSNKIYFLKERMIVCDDKDPSEYTVF